MPLSFLFSTHFLQMFESLVTVFSQPCTAQPAVTAKPIKNIHARSKQELCKTRTLISCHHLRFLAPDFIIDSIRFHLRQKQNGRPKLSAIIFVQTTVSFSNRFHSATTKSAHFHNSNLMESNIFSRGPGRWPCSTYCV